MTDIPTFETFIASERARLGKERDQLLASRAEIDAKLAALDQELRAIVAYETVKAGRAPTPTASSGGSTRRTGQRETVLAVVKAAPNGISSAEVLAKLGASSEADKTSVRNALSALKRNGSIETKEGNYRAK